MCVDLRQSASGWPVRLSIDVRAGSHEIVRVPILDLRVQLRPDA